jgi:hypothetical protein
MCSQRMFIRVTTKYTGEYKVSVAHAASIVRIEVRGLVCWHLSVKPQDVTMWINKLAQRLNPNTRDKVRIT